MGVLELVGELPLSDWPDAIEAAEPGAIMPMSSTCVAISGYVWLRTGDGVAELIAAESSSLTPILERKKKVDTGISIAVP